MYKIVFYDESKSVREFLDTFKKLFEESEKTKKARIEYEKIRMYLDKLTLYGLSLKSPYLKYLRDGLWELRPLDNRLIFFVFEGGNFVILHYFKKRTNKTPKTEIEQAGKELTKYIDWRKKQCQKK